MSLYFILCRGAQIIWKVLIVEFILLLIVLFQLWFDWNSTPKYLYVLTCSIRLFFTYSLRFFLFGCLEKIICLVFFTFISKPLSFRYLYKVFKFRCKYKWLSAIRTMSSAKIK